MRDFVVGFFGVLGLEVFAGDFGEGAAAVVDLRGLGGTTGRWIVSAGDSRIGKGIWCASWCMR